MHVYEYDVYAFVWFAIRTGAYLRGLLIHFSKPILYFLSHKQNNSNNQATLTPQKKNHIDFVIVVFLYTFCKTKTP